MEPNDQIILQDPRFSMNMHGGFKNDIWALRGFVYDHPTVGNGTVFVSTPKSYDQETKILVTYSGRRYLLIDPSAETEDEIFKVIERGAYSCH